MNFLLRILQWWMAWVLPRPRFVLGVVFLSAAASLTFAALRLDIETDQLELISKNHPLIALSDKLDPYNFGGKASLTVAIEAPTPKRAIQFLDELVARIKADPTHYEGELHRVDPSLAKRWALLYLDREDLLKIRETIDDNADLIKGFTHQPDLITLLKLMNKTMASRMVGELFTGFLQEGRTGTQEAPGGDNGPMDLGFLIQTLEGLAGTLNGTGGYKSPWASFFKDAAWNLDLEGYFWEGDRRFLLMFVTPQDDGDGFNQAQHCMDQLRSSIRDLRKVYPDVEAGITGQKALNNDEMTTVLGDMTWATWISIVGVLLLMIGFFRGLRRPLMEMAALVAGLCWTFGWTTVFIGHLNILSVVFAPLLCGLGVDYGIHWFARYEEEEGECGHLPHVVVQRVTNRSGPGILVAGLSGVVSFLPLVLTGFRGFIELGLITGVGILLILIADFTVLPALSVLLPGKRKDEPCRPSAMANGGSLLRFTPGVARVILFCTVILCLLCLWGASKVGFDLNPLRLQAKNAEAVVWEKKLVENSKRSLLSAAAFAASPEEAQIKAKALAALPSVAEVETVFSFLPEDQNEKLPILRSILPKIPEIQSVALPDLTTNPSDVHELRDVLQRIRFKMQEDQANEWGAEKPLVEQMTRVRGLAEEVLRALADLPEGDLLQRLNAYRLHFRDDLIDTWSFFRQAASADPMGLQDVPSLLRNWFYHQGEFLLRIYPRESVWEQDALARFVQQLQGVDAQVVGDPVSLHIFAAAYKKACVLASLYALVAVIVLLLLTFRKLSLSGLALVPLTAGTIWTVGIMGLGGIEFNLANSIFMPLIVGAGVEYGVIILHRWREGRMEPGQLPLSTGKGVILAALTTTVGFGTLMISHHQGIFSLGFVAWAGSLCVLAGAIVLVPAMLSHGKSPKIFYEKET